ncbi:sec-independent translocase [Naumannella huperziae]
MSVGPFEIAVLAILAVVLFGPEKLPEFARKAARVLRYVRGIANDATGQLRRELGPEYADLDLRDLNPKAFVRKHLLEDVEPIIADVKRDVNEAGRMTRTESDGVRSALGAAKRNGSAEPKQTEPKQTEPELAEPKQGEPEQRDEQAKKQTIGEALFSPAPGSATAAASVTAAGTSVLADTGTVTVVEAGAGESVAADEAGTLVASPWDTEAT